VELEELHECMARIECKCATDVMQLSWSVVEISNALADLSMFPIRDSPAHLESAQDVPTAANIILEHLWEEDAPDAGPYSV
jgi:hypothetical protein